MNEQSDLIVLTLELKEQKCARVAVEDMMLGSRYRRSAAPSHAGSYFCSLPVEIKVNLFYFQLKLLPELPIEN